MKLDIKTEG